uniref:Calmodulin-binding protein n=1 Tax=Kalanchoe fedtschenkoi TaxID=63787 RepID=A0A7N0RG98_KALFE
MASANGGGRGKRGFEGDDEQQQNDRKRPALASVIVEALKMDSLQKLCSSLEPILRRVVSEEVERALAKLGPAKLPGRSSPKRIEGPDDRNLQLHFRSKLSLPLFTGGKVVGEQGSAIHVVLVDEKTGHIVTSGQESSTKLDVVVLEGDFNNEDDEDWTLDEFESRVVKEREGKRPLLTGDLQVVLKDGVGTLGELTFTDNSSWIRSRRFRLGLKVAPGFCEGIRVREAKTEAFAVKDHRGELYRKHYPPSFNDEVWRLEKIGKDGTFHKRLNAVGIYSVEEFLRHAVRDSQGLRSILGSGMSNKMWDALLEHAKTCVLSGKLHIYYPDESKTVGVVFNNVYELSGLISGEQFHSADSLSDSQKVYVDKLVKKAYDNWNQVVEYDGKSLVSFPSTESESASQDEDYINPGDYSDPLEQQSHLSHQPASDFSEPPPMNSAMAAVGAPRFSNNLGNAYSANPGDIHFNSQNQNGSSSYLPHNHLIASSGNHPNPSMSSINYNGMVHGSQQQQSTVDFQAVNTSIQPYSQLNLFDDWSNNKPNGADAFLSEEEIRMKSSLMLEHDDIQQMLHSFTSEGNFSMVGPNPQDDGFSFPSYEQSPSPSSNCSYDEDRVRPSKTVVSWLKIKAAMRWGFFVRKKAAEKRAGVQLVELDDDDNEIS